MTIMADPKRRRKTRRIYYGPEGSFDLYWNVKVKPATKTVRINGSIRHAIETIKGSTVGCVMSNCAGGNKKNFGHDFIMAVFTKKTCIVITKLKNGEPSEGIEYYHDYSQLVMLNDSGQLKAYIQKHPELIDRAFSLRPPEQTRHRPGRHDVGPRAGTGDTGEKRAFAQRGAMDRAVAAGLLSKGVAKALSETAISAANPNTPSLRLARRTLKGFKAA